MYIRLKKCLLTFITARNMSMATENEANLVLPPGSNKVTLQAQHPLVHAVIQDSFDYLRASLMFTNTLGSFKVPIIYTIMMFIIYLILF